jgi:hypothetical protein
MYKIPEDIKSDFLRGEIVTMICFSSNQIYIHFESLIQIIIEGQYSLVNEKGEEYLFDVYPVTDSTGILRLLEKKVVNIEINKSRTDLSIRFENDTALNILANDSYESYVIKISERIIII